MRTIFIYYGLGGARAEVNVPDSLARQVFEQLQPIVGRPVDRIVLTISDAEIKAAWQTDVVNGKTELSLAEYAQKELS